MSTASDLESFGRSKHISTYKVPSKLSKYTVMLKIEDYSLYYGIIMEQGWLITPNNKPLFPERGWDCGDAGTERSKVWPHRYPLNNADLRTARPIV